MKRFIQQSTIVLLVLVQIQLWAQPVNTTDVLVSTEFDIDQYNPSVFVNPWNPEEVINSNKKYNHTTQGQVVIFSLQPTDFFQSENTGTSWDAGTSLSEQLTMDFTPNLQIDHTGRYYVSYGDLNKGVYMAWSDDQGSSWQEKQLKAKPDQALYNVSTNTMWIDNSERSMYKGNVYSAWRFVAYEASEYCIELTHSDFGSDEWSNPTNICSYESGDHTFEEWPVVRTGPQGEVYACWMNHDDGPGTGETSIGFNSSFDGGKTFGVNYNILTNIRGLSDYNNLIGLDLKSAPDMAVDVSGGLYDGRSYIVWANVGVPGENTGQGVDIYMIISEAWGNNWSQPIKVNQDPIGSSKEHFMPAITCDPETGTVTVIYYDNRNLGSNMVEVWGSISYDGGSTFIDFQISDAAMNRTDLISYNGNYISDKIGVSAANGKVVPVWADFRSQFCRTVSSPFDEKPVAKPENLQAQVIDWDNGTVLLTWEMLNPVGVLNFNVYRNNQLIASTNETEFEDLLSEFGNYSYRVTAQFADMESAPESDFVDWGLAEFSCSHNTFDVKLEPGTQANYVLKLKNEGTLPIEYSYTIDHDPMATAKDNISDDFGYHWIDSDNPGGPGFEYIDISETGLEISGIENDNSVGPFAMGFSFPFYENYYDEFYISSNGLITFGGSFSNPINSPIPIADGNNNFIAWCWDDLQKKTGGQVFYQQFEDYTIIQFKDYAQNGTFSLRYVINAEIILYKNGDIKIQYLDYTTGLFQTNSCTIGIENDNGDDGLQVAYDEVYLHENLAIRFFNPGVKWLNTNLLYGTIEPEDYDLVFLNFKSLDFPLGEYFANLNFKTNSQLAQEYTIPVKLEIQNSVLSKPEALDYTLSGDDVELTWDAPMTKNLLGYNLYESGEKMNEDLIVETNYMLNNMAPGSYLFQVTAVYSQGESNPEGNPLYVFISAAAEQQIQVPGGWSGISSYVVPINAEMENVLASIEESIVVLQGEEGVYWPAQNINTLGNWDNEQGYKVKLIAEQDFVVSGTKMLLPSVYCNEGWNLIPVLSACEVALVDAFATGFENVVIIKEIAGAGVYWSAMGINTLQMLKPGKAYEMLLIGDASMYFPDCDQNPTDDQVFQEKIESPWENTLPTGISHTIALNENATQFLETGDVLGVFNEDGLCVGMAQYSGSSLAITVFGDDPTSNELDGMFDDSEMTFKLFRPSVAEEYFLDVTFREDLPNKELFSPNGLSAIQSITTSVLDIDEQNRMEYNIYPNPSSGTIWVAVSNMQGTTTLEILNACGQVVLVQEIQNENRTKLQTDLPNGVYFAKFKNQDIINSEKIIISQ